MNRFWLLYHIYKTAIWGICFYHQLIGILNSSYNTIILILFKLYLTAVALVRGMALFDLVVKMNRKIV